MSEATKKKNPYHSVCLNMLSQQWKKIPRYLDSPLFLSNLPQGRKKKKATKKEEESYWVKGSCLLPLCSLDHGSGFSWAEMKSK